MAVSSHQALTWIAGIDYEAISRAFKQIESIVTNGITNVVKIFSNSKIVSVTKQIGQSMVEAFHPVSKLVSPTGPGSLFLLSKFFGKLPIDVADSIDKVTHTLSIARTKYGMEAAEILKNVSDIASQSKATGANIREVGKAVSEYLQQATNQLRALHGSSALSSTDILKKALSTKALSPRDFTELIKVLKSVGALGSEELCKALMVGVKKNAGAIGVTIGYEALKGVVSFSARFPAIILGAVYTAVRKSMSLLSTPFSYLMSAARMTARGVLTVFETVLSKSWSVTQSVLRMFHLWPKSHRISIDADSTPAMAALNDLTRRVSRLLSFGGAFSGLIQLFSPLYLIHRILGPVIDIIQNQITPLLIPLQIQIAKIAAEIIPFVYTYLPKLQIYLAKLSPLIIPVVHSFIDWTKAIISYVKSHPQIIEALKIAGTMIGAYVVAVRAASLVTKAWYLAMSLISASPLILVGAAVVGLIYGFKDLFNDVKNGTVSFTKFADRAVEKFNWIKEKTKDIWKEIQPIFNTYVKPFILSTINSIVEFAKNLPKYIVSGIQYIKSFCASVWSFLKPWVDSTINLFGTIYSFGARIFAAIKPYILSTWEGLKSFGLSVWEIVKGTSKGLIPVIWGLVEVFKAVWKIIPPIFSALVNLGKSVWGFIGPGFTFLGNCLLFVWKIIQPVVTITQFFIGVLLKGFSYLVPVIGKVIENLITFVSWMWKGATAVVSGVNWMFDKVKDGINSALNKMPNWMKKAVCWLWGIDPAEIGAAIEAQQVGTQQQQIVSAQNAASGAVTQIAATATALPPEIAAEVPVVIAALPPSMEQPNLPSFPTINESPSSTEGSSEISSKLDQVVDKADTYRVVDAINNMSDLFRQVFAINQQKQSLLGKDVPGDVLKKAAFV